MAKVIFEHVTKRWGDVAAVRDLNIEIHDKEFVVFVGPSGCGKSTTLRMLAGLDSVTEGSIAIGDRLVNDVSPKDRDIAMVFQSYALYPDKSVYDNMAFGLRLRDLPDNRENPPTGMRRFLRRLGLARNRMPKSEINRRVTEAARDLGLETLLKRKPGALSGGQRQRVAVGRAIVREPAVFLMDEPLSNLDAKLRVEARAMIQRLHQRLETTFVYVTHDQIEAMTMGSRIAVMKDGVLQQLDTPQNLYNNPANLFVAGFIGSPGMNFFDAKIMEDNSALTIDAGAFRVKAPSSKSEALSKRAGQPIVVGVRPEDIHDAAFAPPGITPIKIEGVVTMRELTGSEVLLFLQAGGSDLVARVDPRTQAVIGGKTQIALDADKIYVFDAGTQAAIQ